MDVPRNFRDITPAQIDRDEHTFLSVDSGTEISKLLYFRPSG
jgi:hypothetical protein